MAVYCDYCGEQMTSAPEHYTHLDRECSMTPKALLKKAEELLSETLGNSKTSARLRKAVDQFLPKLRIGIERAKR